MENEEKTKQVWQTPEIVDLDVEKTESGVYGISHEREYSAS